MQRWVKQTDINRVTVHCVKDTLEVSFLIRQELSQSFLTTGSVFSQNHFAHSDNLLVVKEHVLGTSQTNTFGTKGASNLSIVRGVGISADLETRIFVTEVHQGFEITTEFSSLSRDLSGINLSGRTIQADVITFFISNAFDFDGFSFVVNLDCSRT